MNINGVSSKTINLAFLVYGASGQTGQAQVMSQESASSRKSNIAVRKGRSLHRWTFARSLSSPADPLALTHTRPTCYST